MPFFKPKDGPGYPRIQYCGYVKGPGGAPTIGIGSKTINPIVNDAASARTYLQQLLATNKILDPFNNPIGVSKNYQISSYNGYNESKSKPGTFYHDFVLSSPDDSFCQSGGKRRCRKLKNTKRIKRSKSRKTKRRR